MQHPLRARTATAALAGMFLLMHLAPATLAGTEAAPEIEDAADDQEGPGGTPLCAAGPGPACLFGSMDVLSAWIDNETATTINVNIRVSVAPAASANYDNNWEFRATFDGAEVVASVGTQAANGPSPGGVATGAQFNDTLITMTIPKSAFGAVTPGSTLTGIHVVAVRYVTGTTQATLASDRAPDAESGSDFAFAGGNNTTTPGDTDADGLPDAWEQQHFGNMDSNGTADPDNDGCDNACEFANGTDPNNGDTDGDGIPDGTEIQNGTDPTDPNSPPPSTTSPPPTSAPPTTSPTTGPTTSPPTTSPPGGDGGERSMGDRFKQAMDSGYLFIAGALALVVVVLSILGRAWRWGL